jgi:glycosyltransferase involved in cell wall biosynthesis
MHSPTAPAAPIPLVMVKGAYLSAGGPETLLRLIADNLDREGFPPLLALLARPGEQLPPVLADVAARLPTERLDWHGIAGSPFTARRVAALLAARPGAILHTNDMRANLLGWMITRIRRVPWIAHVHGWLLETHSGRHKVFEEIDRRLVPFADMVLVGSAAMEVEVKRAGAKRTGIVTNGIPAADAAAHAAEAASIRARVAPSGGLIAGVLGRLHPGKGQALLIEALPGLRAKGLDITVVLVGIGQAEDEYRALAQRLGVADHVHFAGLVPEILPWLCAMDVMCAPSLRDSMPLTVMEAMSVGCPVIGSRAGDLPLLVQHGQTGLVVDVGSVQGLADALETLARDPALRARLGAAGRQRLIDHYSPGAMLRQLEGFCATLAQEERARGR